MRVELTIFEDENQTKRGVLRALAAMCFIAVFSFGWYFLIGKSVPESNKSCIGIFIILLLLGSAIAVQFPTNSRTAVTYGALLGLLVYGVANGMLLMSNGMSVPWALADIGRGMLTTSMTAFLVYKIFF